MKTLRRTLQIILITLGSILTLIIILSFTSAPFWIRYGMGMKKASVNRPPDYIVVLGGGGMPSESGLIRCWYAAKTANYFPRAKVIVALPGDTADSLSSINQMKNELILRGISPGRILYENSGANTRAEALNIRKIVSSVAILIITSPEHLYRAVLTFKKIGFLKVDGIPTFEKDLETDLSFDAMKLGGRKFIPDVGKNLTLRYKFWTYLHYEELILREFAALGYYKLMGWI